MNVLLIANGPAYGSEQPFNALRLAGALAKREDVHVRLFLMGDAVVAAIDNQDLPDGYYHLDRMLRNLARKGGEIGCCGTCLDARGLSDDQLVEGAERSTMEELADWTLEADRIVTF
ncbi:MAG: DsrE/DsrF/TusD sulfur relay family protein [Nitriliruptoraceae bacterium]